MNLSPVWATILQEAGFESVHWSQVGKPTASDKEIFDWAAEHGYVVITHDLDFDTILAHFVLD
jgi:predicted nuclease of predicted toxin-antitoxin system